MRLMTFVLDAGGEPRIGAETTAGIIDFLEAAPALPQTLLGLLTAGAPALKTARAVVARALDDRVGLLPADRTRLLAPIARPGKIFGIGFNYREHAAETGNPIPAVPFVFLKAATAVIGPGAAIGFRRSARWSTTKVSSPWSSGGAPSAWRAPAPGVRGRLHDHERRLGARLPEEQRPLPRQVVRHLRADGPGAGDRRRGARSAPPDIVHAGQRRDHAAGEHQRA